MLFMCLRGVNPRTALIYCTVTALLCYFSLHTIILEMLYTAALYSFQFLVGKQASCKDILPIESVMLNLINLYVFVGFRPSAFQAKYRNMVLA